MRSIYHSVMSGSTGNCLFFLILPVLCIVQKSAYKTNLTCTGIHKQEMHKISFCVFRHSLSAILRKTSQQSKQCFRNGPLSASQLHPWTRTKISRFLLNTECTNTHTHTTHNTTGTLPIFGCRGGPTTIAYHLVQTAVPSNTAYMELVQISPLLF